MDDEWQIHLAPKRSGHPTEVVRVAGARIGFDLYRGRPRILTWLHVLWLGFPRGPWTTLSVQRDIVILDDLSGRELYREGPYTGTGAQKATEMMAAEINRSGLAAFLLERRTGQPGRLFYENQTPIRQGLWGLGELAKSAKRRVSDAFK